LTIWWSFYSNDNECFGIISYMAPEIWRGKKYTTASDIYSFGMIMWELTTGRMPFWDQNYDLELTIKICNKFRPPIINSTPKGYNELMQKCWDSDPNKRPTASYIYEILSNIKKVEEVNPTEIKKSLDIGPIIINDLDKSQSLGEVIKSAESIRSSKSQSITSILGK